MGIKLIENDLTNCETFQLNKSKKLPVPKDSETRASEVLAIVYTDILGPIHLEAVDRHRYAIDFVDSFNRYQRLFFSRTSDEAFLLCPTYLCPRGYSSFYQFFADIGQPSTLVCDGACEYVSNDKKQLRRQKSVRLEFSAPYTPQENEKAERNWRLAPQGLYVFLEQSGLEKEYWPNALNMASEIRYFCFHSGFQKTALEAGRNLI